MEAEQECTTPKNQECQIAATLAPPPPPKKKRRRRTNRDPPNNGYFHPPELDAFFSNATWAQDREIIEPTISNKFGPIQHCVETLLISPME